MKIIPTPRRSQLPSLLVPKPTSTTITRRRRMEQQQQRQQQLSFITTVQILVILSLFIPHILCFYIPMKLTPLPPIRYQQLRDNTISDHISYGRYTLSTSTIARYRKASSLFGVYSYSNNDKNMKDNIRNSSSSSSSSSTATTTTTTHDDKLDGVIKVIQIQKDRVEIEMIIPPDVTLTSYNTACLNLSQNMHFPGFPRGAELPHTLVELIHGKHTIQLDAVTTLISNHIATYIERTLLHYHYNPVYENPPRVTMSYEHIASTLYKPGEPLVFTVECDIIPEPEPEPEPVVIIEDNVFEDSVQQSTSYSSNDSDKPVEELLVRSDPTAWNRELYESMQSEFADLEPVDSDYKLRIGDACEVQMVGYMINKSDGSIGLPLPSNTKRDTNVLGDRVMVLLKGGKYMPGLVEGLIGMTMGAKISLFVNFPNVCTFVFFLLFFVNGKEYHSSYC
jgi:hypothetical protein